MMKNWALKKLINDKGYTQKMLAADAGVSPAYMSYVVERKKDPSMKVLLSMSRSLDIPAGDLIEMLK